MREVMSLNITEDKSTQKKLIFLSLALLVIPVLLAIVWIVLTSSDGMTFELTLPFLVMTLAGTIVVLLIHEVIHGIAFKLLGRPGAHISFGYTQGMLYATSPDEVYTRQRYQIIVAAPFVVLTILLLGATFMSPLSASFLLILVIHTSGCAGDLYYLWLMWRHPEITHAKDTDYGVVFYDVCSEKS